MLNTTVNSPDIWLQSFPQSSPEQHKYDRGATLVVSGDLYKSGAAKLAALAALRIGSGLVTIIAPDADASVYAISALSLMTAPYSQWNQRIQDKRLNTLVIGPGTGVGVQTQEFVLSALHERKSVVLDADALTSFAAVPEELFSAIRSPCLLTPHAGEFQRLFPDLAPMPKELAAVEAAKRASSVVIYKGHHTIIAAPDGQAVTNTNAPPTLATAGSGDVLSGIAAGLLAQGMPAFYAGCAAVWIHGESARLHGEGLIAEDIIPRLPQVLHELRNYPVIPVS